MAIFTFLGGLISSALFGGALLATKLIAAGLALATQLAVSYLNRPKKRSYSAVQGQVQYGADVPTGTAFGMSKVKGQRVFYAKYGKGNKFNAEVFALANGWCDGLEPEIYFYGVKHALIPRPIIGNEVAHYGVGDFGNLISIRFYDGRPGQGPDTKLVSDTANLGKIWKATSVGTGICYVVVERQWDEDKFKHGRPEFEFILRGLREYDPRFDSTAGGSGPQRLNDPATWAWTENPAIHRLNYVLGVEGRVSGRTLIGMGKPISAIDLGSHIASANVCDAIRKGKKTYACSLYVQADDDHTEILREIEDAMAGYGMNRYGLSGVLAGAPQLPVMNIGPIDIRGDEGKQITPRKSAFELFNSLSGQFTSKESHWKPESLKTVTVNNDIATDGRRREGGNDFLQVTDPDIGQYLLNIRYRQQRKGGAIKLPVSRRAGLKAEIGSWVTFDGKTWLVTGRGFDGKLRFTLQLSETGPDIYDDEDIEPGPIIIPPTPPVNPSLLTTVQDFTVEVGLVDGPDGYAVPALRFKWTPPDDPTIIAVRFEYFEGDNPTGKTVYTWRSDAPESGEELTSANVAPAARYTARATIVTVPDRFKSWTAWFTTVDYTGDIYYPGLVEQIDQHVEEMLDWLDSDSPIYELGQEVAENAAAISAEAQTRANQIATERAERMVDVGGLADRWRSLYETVNRTAFSVAQNWIGQKREFVVVREELADVDAGARSYADDVVNLAVGPGSALSERLTTIEASADADYTALSGAIDTVQQVALNAVADEATARQALRIQLVGNYTGNDIEQVTSGLLYQDRQAWISATQSLSTAIDLVAAGIGSASLFDWIREWSWEAALLGWTGNGTPTVANGWLRPANHASDPYIVSPATLGVNGSLYKQVRLYIRKTGNPVWDGYLWWQADSDTTWDAARRVAITEPTYIDGQAAVTVNAEWTGTLNRIRIDLSGAQTANDYFEVSYVYIGRPSPGASQAQVAAAQQALASQILAEASNREALSVALTGLAHPTGATIPSLSQGLLYDERVARVSGDEANTLLIQGVAARIEDPATGLDALAQVQSTMQGQISSLDGVVMVMGQSIDDLLLSVDDLQTGKADIGITDGLQAQINQMGGGEGLSLLAESMRSMRLTVDRLALGQAGVWLAGQNDRRELGNIVADVHQEATSRIDVTDDQVALHGRILDQINLDLGGKADLTLVSALDGRVTATEGQIVNIGQSILSIQGSIGALETGKADASVLVNYRTILDSYSKAETDTVATTAATSATTTLSSALTPQIVSAQNAAQAASDLAGGKGEVIYSASAPAVAKRLPQNLWIDITGNANTPKRWNGSAWVAVTDKAATDAAAAAANAQATANANANAVSALGTRVTSTEAGLQSLSEALIGVDAKVDGVSAEGKFRVAATATETGALSTLGLSTAATANGATSQAAMLMSARSDGKSMIGFLADMIYFKDPAGKFDPFVIEDGAAYFNRARIRNLDATNITADKLDARLILQEGSLITDLLAFNAVTEWVPMQWSRYVSKPPNGYGYSDGAWITVKTVVIDIPPNRPMIEFMNIRSRAYKTGGNGNFHSIDLYTRIMRNGDILLQQRLQSQSTGVAVGTNTFTANHEGAVTYEVLVWHDAASQPDVQWLFEVIVDSGVLSWKK